MPRTRPADHRDLCRPATLALLVVPLGMLGGGTSTMGRVALITVIAALAIGAALSVLAGLVPMRHSYLWITLLAGLLLASFAYPSVTTPVTPAERQQTHQIVVLVRMLGRMDPAHLERLFDLAGLMAGLALLGVCVATGPHPRQVARVIALSGMTAAGYVLVRGGYDNVRLEGLGCNPNYLGYLLALPAVAAVGLIRYARNPRWLVPAAVCFLALVQTHSRSAFLAAASGIVLVSVQGRSRLFRFSLLATAVTAGTVAAAGGVLTPLGRHLENLGAGGRTAIDLNLSNSLRERAAALAARVSMEHPLRGIGLSRFPAYAEQSPDFGVYLATHDDYLRLAAEAGITTLVVFLVLLLLAVARPQTGDLALLRAVVLTYGMILLFANPLANPVVSTPFWIAMGCLLASRPSRGISVPAAVGGAAGALWRRRRVVWARGS